MTLSEIQSSTKEVLSPKDVSGLLRCKPYTLNVTAKEGRLSIPHSFVGNRLKIPRQAFLKWFMGGDVRIDSMQTQGGGTPTESTTQKTALLEQDGSQMD